MSRKTKIITVTIISLVVFLMLFTAYLVAKFGGFITGGTSISCGCTSDESCDDNDPCTEDICLYPENCYASRCIHIEKEECKIEK
ncbi:hypothetical protein DRJ19_02315 [Candidatus Woesearchaeota archaeon]|nr:MAG: hypothetical protein DRJ19_02315 [Candidatus Woesearchaeota archaeon]